MSYVDRCDTCGKFHSTEQPGASWGQYWSYAMDGSPDLHDPRYRCAACTDRIGEVGTNCIPEGYAGRNPHASSSPVGSAYPNSERDA